MKGKIEERIFIFPFVPISSPPEGENEKNIFGVSEKTGLSRREFDMRNKGMREYINKC